MLNKLFNIFSTPEEREVQKLINLLISKTLSGEIVWDKYNSTTINNREFYIDAPWDAEGLISCTLYCDKVSIAYTRSSEPLLNAIESAKDMNRQRMANQLYNEMSNPPCSMTQNRSEIQVIHPKKLRLSAN